LRAPGVDPQEERDKNRHQDGLDDVDEHRCHVPDRKLHSSRPAWATCLSTLRSLSARYRIHSPRFLRERLTASRP
jgi:hypothetical protein